MVAAGITVPRSRLGGKLRGVRNAITTAAVAVVSPHTASLKRLADMPLSVAGFAAIDFAAFHYVHMLGWAVTGLSLFALEHMIADE